MEIKKDSKNIKTNEENHKENDRYIDLKKVMYNIAPGTLLNAPWGPGGKEVQNGGDLRICGADSFCCTVETNATL